MLHSPELTWLLKTILIFMDAPKDMLLQSVSHKLCKQFQAYIGETDRSEIISPFRCLHLGDQSDVGPVYILQIKLPRIKIFCHLVKVFLDNMPTLF